MPWATVLEEAHLTSFFAGVLLLSLGSLVIASRLSSGIRRGLIAATFVAAVADVLLPLAVVATGHGCTLRAASSFLSVGLFAALALVALIRFGKAPR